jgi:hypothetical protein
MKTVLLSLILVLSPTVALAEITPQTREILKKRVCLYLKSGFTTQEVLNQMAYHVSEHYPYLGGVGNSLGADLNNIMADYIFKTEAIEITFEAIKTKCPQFKG